MTPEQFTVFVNTLFSNNLIVSGNQSVGGNLVVTGQANLSNMLFPSSDSGAAGFPETIRFLLNRVLTKTVNCSGVKIASVELSYLFASSLMVPVVERTSANAVNKHSIVTP